MKCQCCKFENDNDQEISYEEYERSHEETQTKSEINEWIIAYLLDQNGVTIAMLICPKCKTMRLG